MNDCARTDSVRVARVGLIGLGAVSAVHLQAYQSSPSIKVIAVTDLSEEKVRRVAAQQNVRGYSSAAELLRSEDLDIACVLTPTAAHAQTVIECARAGVHVLCEKPLALSIEGCENMIAACRESGVQLCYGASYRYLPALIAAREIIRSGKLGEILLLRESCIGGSGPQNRQTLGPQHFPPGGPGGSSMGLIDHGIHLIDTFSWLMDSPVRRTFGRGNISAAPQGPEFMVMEFGNGAMGHLLYEDGTYATELPAEGAFSWGGGWDAHGITPPGKWQAFPGSIHVHGSSGALRIQHYTNHLYWMNETGVRQVELAGAPMPGNFRLQMETFAAAVLRGQPSPVPGEVGLAACRALLDAYSRPWTKP